MFIADLEQQVVDCIRANERFGQRLRPALQADKLLRDRLVKHLLDAVIELPDGGHVGPPALVPIYPGLLGGGLGTLPLFLEEVE